MLGISRFCPLLSMLWFYVKARFARYVSEWQRSAQACEDSGKTHRDCRNMLFIEAPTPPLVHLKEGDISKEFLVCHALNLNASWSRSFP